MANYVCAATRSNYFRVVDKAAFRELVSNIVSEEPFEIWASDDGKVAFGSYGSIDGCLYDKDPGFDCCDDLPGEDFVYKAIQNLLPDGEACIITSVGSEKLRYIGADSVIITRDGLDVVSLALMSADRAAEMLHDSSWVTRMDY